MSTNLPRRGIPLGAAGTQAAPWATIAHAQSVAASGDTVHFRGGTYSFTKADTACSSQTARVDGVALSKNGIRYWAYPGEKPGLDPTTAAGLPTIDYLDLA